MIYTSYFDNISKIPDDVICYSVAGKSPKWYLDLSDSRHRTCPLLMPKYVWWKEWHAKFADDLDSVESKTWYEWKYYETVLDGLNADAVARLLAEHNDRDVCLLCYETPDKFCHRQIIAKWLNDNGIECKEL